MVLNVVLHRYNLDHIGRIIEMAVEMGVEYLELANTQYYAWASVNREQLMPTREQLVRAEATVQEYRAKLGNKLKLLFVVPDLFEDKPKACMNGWGSVFFAVAADGSALPCHAAQSIPGLTFPNVTEQSLHDIWHHSDAFNAFRGYEWMKEPCRSCSEKEKDFGGCRCQAFALTGDARNADPVCGKSPQHDVVKQIVLQTNNRPVEEKPLVFRNDMNSVRFAAEAEKQTS
jgi:pyrroloquinoline quinone biosynthesis protein E